MAATNLHPQACRNLSRALRQGLGTTVNPVAAYAWLSLYANTLAGRIGGQVELNELALKLDTDALKQAKHLAAQFKAGHWQMPSTLAIPASDPRLKLSGIALGKTPLAVINGKSLSEGESIKLTLKSDSLVIKCLKIQSDSVLIAVEGEDTPRLLELNK
jgi:hypothetical protein